MLETLGEDKAAAAMEKAMIQTIGKMQSQAAGKMGYSTTEVGDLVVSLL
jgi:3-isopropylmalate dehydrogenase